MAKDGGARRSSCGPRISGGDYISASSNQSGGGARDEPSSSSSSPPPSALEALLDLELLGAPAALEDNQATAAQLRAPVGDAFGELSALSLELLALQSPHGGHQHWDDDGDDGNAGDSSAQAADRRKLRAPEEPSPLRGTGALFALERASDTELLASPSQHSVPFLPSPCHSADGDEYDLASPVALPDTPRTAGSFEEPSGMPPLPSASVTDTQTTAVSRWESAPDLRHEVDDYIESGSLPPAPPVRTPSRSVAKREHRTPFARAPRSVGGATPSRTAAHPALSTTQSSLSSSQHLQQPQQLQPPASIPKQKVKHGGIYSLLLKNRGAGDHEPVLVDEKRSPEAPEGAGRHELSPHFGRSPMISLAMNALSLQCRRIGSAAQPQRATQPRCVCVELREVGTPDVSLDGHVCIVEISSSAEPRQHLPRLATKAIGSATAAAAAGRTPAAAVVVGAPRQRSPSAAFSIHLSLSSV